MNPGVIFLPAFFAFLSWSLIGAIRRGEFSFRIGTDSRQGPGTVSLKRSESPQVFWGVAALYVGILLMLVWVFIQVLTGGG